jgi:hypothetical protein
MLHLAIFYLKFFQKYPILKIEWIVSLGEIMMIDRLSGTDTPIQQRPAIQEGLKVNLLKWLHHFLYWLQSAFDKHNHKGASYFNHRKC